MNPGATRLWPAALAAISGSAMVGVMPLVARRLYADGLDAPSMLFWRYSLALVALAIAAKVVRHDLRRAWQGGAWRIALVGATLGAAQTLCFWESIKTLETSIAVLLFYTYPAVTLALDRVFFKEPIRPLAVLCIGVILAGAGLITGPGLRGGTIDGRGLAWALPAPLIYALYLAINARLLRRHPPLVGASGLFAGMAVTFGLAAAFAGLDVPATSTGWMLLVFIALGPGALTMTLFSYSVPRLGAGSFAILANAELVTVVLLGVLVLGEAFTPGSAIGGALIVAGILTHALSRQPAVPVAAPTLPRLRRGSIPPPHAGEGFSARQLPPPPRAGEGWGGGA
jgi:drug/metabolite transporter (DMT)-like permease